MNKRNIFVGILIFIIYLTVNLFIHKDYGLSWDYHYHHYAGLHHLGQKVPSVNEVVDVPFSLPDPRLTVNDPFGPFTQIIPTLSQIIFSEKLNILPFDQAYNLPMVIFGSLGVLVLYLFLLEAFNLPVALTGALFLALNPYYFGYLHNNMKDIPNAFAFALTVYLFYRLIKKPCLLRTLAASLAFAFAFNIKINSVFIPVVLAIFYMTSVLMDKKRKLNLIIISFFPLSLLLALLVWWPFWRDPLGKLLEIPKFYSLNTINMPVLIMGRIYYSGVNIPWSYPYIYLAITTPLAIFISFLTGLAVSLIRAARKNNAYLLLLLWFFVPLLRYLSPKAGAIDGVRHFMEVLFPFSALAAIGFVEIVKTGLPAGQAGKKYLTGPVIYAVSAAIFLILIRNLVFLHPYQTSYFSSLVGGIRGAEGNFDLDFWGTPQREAAFWLNKKAEPAAFIHFVMAQSTASLYLRDDLKKNANRKNMEDSDYTVILNRQSFFSLYPVKEYLLHAGDLGTIAFVVERNGIPLVWIVRN